MNDADLTDARIQALLEGQMLAGAPPETSDVVIDLRPQSRTTRPVISSSALAEFLDIVELTIIPGQPRAPKTRRRVLAGGGAFAATAAGKLVLGTALAAALVGGAHATQVVDVPLLPDIGDGVELQVGDPNGARQDPAASFRGESTEGGAPAVDSGDHGATVSDFVGSTDLEGCEKGQAASDVASANASAHRTNAAGDRDPCSKNDNVAVGEPGLESVGDAKTNNGNSEPGKPTAPGQSSVAPGQSGVAPGQSGVAPGQTGDVPEQSGVAPGQSGVAPGQSGVAPGKSGDAPGQTNSGGKPATPGKP